MPEAYIVAATRTAGGRRNGRLRNWAPADLGGVLLDELVRRAGIDPAAIDDVIMGCVSQAGEQAQQIARACILSSNLPQSVPGVTIDRQCGSSQQALHFAAQAVMSGQQDIVIAGGVESMTRVPMGAPRAGAAAIGLNRDPWTPRILERYGVTDFSQFVGAEMIAAKYGFTKADTDAFGLESQTRAAAATEVGAFKDEIFVVDGVDAEGNSVAHDRDEGIRYGATLEALAGVKLLQEGGVLTAATSSQICDAASGLLVVSESALKAHNLTPMARVHAMAVTGGDPVIMLEEPVFGTQKLLAKAGMKIADIDLYEVNEAFATVPMAWLKVIEADPARLNVNGGAIALGHPLGASGTKLMTTLIHALRARGGRYGFQTMCEGGGLANMTIVEAL
ncbi:acetyl-CoA acetyltransferase [Novosphingobium sp. AAP83]|uniref:acetyl-CoA C-acetyltransferase n=1 Tax=Novosphingobium sp. AAP83 TaxID=1523425 RepID=UPI0006B931DB|nr:acetyl-CoA C-acetyltransferase [Novosphingobium sp. AAP83]KPF86965.1 acetyl-CoA acetyltransferase [Novosphingobium sp. AAP83]